MADKYSYFQLGSSEGSCKGSLAWAAALQSPGYLMSYRRPLFNLSSDGHGKLDFNNKTILMDEYGAQCLSSGMTYRINMDEFEFIREIGRGQYGLVLLVQHKPSGKIMALKDLRLEVSPDSVKQVMMELNVLSRAESQSIIEFYGAFHNRSSIFFCLEFMEAGSIESLKLSKGPLPEDVLCAVAFSVLQGMYFLYKEMNVMHRGRAVVGFHRFVDIKPSNILVNRKGKVKLCDFGVSGYLPERVAIDVPKAYTTKADIWSLGVTLYEAATGDSLFCSKKFDGPFAQLMAILHDPPPNLPEGKFSEVCQDFLSIWAMDG
ncbi:STE/STE7 protein kinase [Paramicrosporidium saccamoebae]|uniref:mitogen-activated protein kinase kinase n=1 Tax=Paramicrosporidium saccamoebae TaxID=1246581 RepID=A0A2H9TLV8_9FUNG|nr:STE/STE7 protein kinase [Paramicrosporidium saccamoebae]